MKPLKISLTGFASHSKAVRRKEIYSEAVAFATATCPYRALQVRAKALLRKEIYSEALAFASATCQFLEVYLKHLLRRIFISYCINNL